MSTDRQLAGPRGDDVSGISQGRESLFDVRAINAEISRIEDEVVRLIEQREKAEARYIAASEEYQEAKWAVSHKLDESTALRELLKVKARRG